MLDYKEFIGEVVAYLLGIDRPWTDDQRFNEMIDDLYHINVYINRVSQYLLDIKWLNLCGHIAFNRMLVLSIIVDLARLHTGITGVQ